MANDSRYKVPGLENIINRIIGFIFYWRLLWVLLTLVVIICFATHSYNYSNTADKLRNFSIIITGGSIIIGIFYSLINYEHNQIKFKYDVKSSKEILTYSTASHMHKDELMVNFQTLRRFYMEHSDLFTQSKWKDIEAFWAQSPNVRLSFIIVFNYLECISIGVEQKIMDEVFLKEFFKTLFKDYLGKYGTYLEHLRRVNNSDRIFGHFTKLATAWKNED